MVMLSRGRSGEEQKEEGRKEGRSAYTKASGIEKSITTQVDDPRDLNTQRGKSSERCAFGNAEIGIENKSAYRRGCF